MQHLFAQLQQAEAVVPLDDSKGKIADAVEKSKQQANGERVNQQQNHHQQAVGQMQPFSATRLHNELIQIFDRNVGQMALGKTILGNMLGQAVLPLMNAQMILVPVAVSLPFLRLIALFLERKERSGKLYTSDKSGYAPHGGQNNVTQKDVEKISAPKHLSKHRESSFLSDSFTRMIPGYSLPLSLHYTLFLKILIRLKKNKVTKFKKHSLQILAKK